MTTVRPRRHARRTGSAMLIGLVFSIALGVILASFIALNRLTLKNSDRALHSHASVNVAEAGVDEALWALNKYQLLAWDPVDPTAFTGWTTSGSIATANATAKRTIVAFSQNSDTGEFTSVLDWGTRPSQPTLVVRAKANMAGRGTVEKYLWCKLTRRSLFANGLVARKSVVFSGNNVAVDSYKSANGAYNTTTNRYSNGSVASASVLVDPVVVGNADIWGRVATGGMQPDVGPNGTIAPIGSPQGTVDTSRITTDFQANLEPLAQPTAATVVALEAEDTTAIQYQTFGSLPAKDAANNYVLGDPTGTYVQYYFLVGNVSLNGTEHIKIQGPVVLVLANDFSASGGNTGIDIDASAAGIRGLFNTTGSPATAAQLKDAKKPPLMVFTKGDFTLTGQGLANNDPVYGVPGAVQIQGTNTSSQNIDITGNGFLSATVFAPNADVKVVGNGDTYGSIVANNIKYTGNGAFHFDESLLDLQTGKWAVDMWKELLKPTERTGAWEGKTYTF